MSWSWLLTWCKFVFSIRWLYALYGNITGVRWQHNQSPVSHCHEGLHPPPHHPLHACHSKHLPPLIQIIQHFPLTGFSRPWNSTHDLDTDPLPAISPSDGGIRVPFPWDHKIQTNTWVAYLSTHLSPWLSFSVCVTRSVEQASVHSK